LQFFFLDLGLYFGDEDDEQLEQEDKALSYLVLNNDQDDSFDPVDTENLLAQMSGGTYQSWPPQPKMFLFFAQCFAQVTSQEANNTHCVFCQRYFDDQNRLNDVAWHRVG